MKLSFKHILALALPLLLFLACSREDPSAAGVDYENLSLKMTKADGAYEGLTMSAYLFISGEVSAKRQGAEGTYGVIDGELVPCAVSESGITKDLSKGLRVSTRTSYVFSLASPAESLSKIGSTDYYGIPYGREQESGKEKRFIYVSDSLYLKAFYLNSQYTYPVGSFKEKRSKLRFKIICSDELESGVEINEASLKDVLKSSWYLPQTGLFYHSDATDVFEEPFDVFPAETLPQSIAPGDSIKYDTVPPPCYIISQDYSALDGNSNPLYVMPRLELKIGETLVSLPLNKNFRAQETVTFTITIKSSIAGISLDITGWTSVPESNIEFDYQPAADADSIKTEPWTDIASGCEIGE